MTTADDLVTITVSRADVEKTVDDARLWSKSEAPTRLLAALPPKPEPEWEPPAEMVRAYAEAWGVVGGPGFMTPEDASQSDKINALRHEFPDGGWLSTLVWNVRNAYSAWPDGKIEAQAVRKIIEGFLAELDALAAALTEHEGAGGPPVALEWQGWRQWAKAIQAEAAALRTGREALREALDEAVRLLHLEHDSFTTNSEICDTCAFLARTDTGGQE